MLISQIKDILRPIYAAFQRVEMNLLWHISPRLLANYHYKRCYHRALNWEHPHDVDEKINWLKFNGQELSRWVTLADKFRVRSYVEECGLGDMLVPLYGQWNKAEEIDWAALPERFVMKTNNGSGDVLICHEKSKLDTAHWTRKFSKLLKLKYGLDHAESHYAQMQPCIVAEELLDCTKQAVTSSSLVDYKIWSFDGRPAYIWVCFNRTAHSCEVMVYDLDWNAHPEFCVDRDHYKVSHTAVPRPETLERMLDAAARLSKGFPIVRVDLYEVDSKPYFGEMTFTPAAGFNYFYTREFLNILGELAEIGVN